MLPGLLARCALVTIVFAAAGCDSDEGSPIPGKVSVEFVSMTDSEVIARLENGLDRPIHIKGYRTLSRAIQVSGSGAQIGCITSPGHSESTLLGFSDGPQPKFVELSPNNAAKVVIRTTFPQQYKGSRCSLELTLKDGTTVGPTEFRP